VHSVGQLTLLLPFPWTNPLIFFLLSFAFPLELSVEQGPSNPPAIPQTASPTAFSNCCGQLATRWCAPFLASVQLCVVLLWALGIHAHGHAHHMNLPSLLSLLLSSLTYCRLMPLLATLSLEIYCYLDGLWTFHCWIIGLDLDRNRKFLV